MFKNIKDNTLPIITAKAHIDSCHKNADELKLPSAALLFYMNGGVEHLLNKYNCEIISEKFPRFLNSCPIYKAADYGFCFLSGGHGAPQAVDTLETLNALGVKRVITIGMYGAFSKLVNSGDILIPSKAFVEEGTSLHYYDSIEFSTPNKLLHTLAKKHINGIDYPIVSTDAVYRQTFHKEQEWRNKGAVGVDMETSALFSVGKYLGVSVVSILIASDKHPTEPSEPKWQWHMPKEMRIDFFERCIDFAKCLPNESA